MSDPWVFHCIFEKNYLKRLPETFKSLTKSPYIRIVVSRFTGHCLGNPIQSGQNQWSSVSRDFYIAHHQFNGIRISFDTNHGVLQTRHFSDRRALKQAVGYSFCESDWIRGRSIVPCLLCGVDHHEWRGARLNTFESRPHCWYIYIFCWLKNYHTSNQNVLYQGLTPVSVF